MSNISSTFLSKQEFRRLYGERTYATAQHLEKLYKKQTKLEQSIKFLVQCKQHDLIPNGFKIKNTTNINKNEKLIRQTMCKIRNNTLKYKQQQLTLNNIEINTQNTILNLYLKTAQPIRDNQNDLLWINKYDKNFRNKLIKGHERKIMNSQKKQENEQSTPTTTTNTKKTSIANDTPNVVNISKTKLNQEQLKVLSKGLKFIPTPTNINIVTTIANCEKYLYSTSKTIKNAAISEITTFIQKWKKPKKSNLNRPEIKTLKEIKSIKDIIMVQADKGGKIMIIDKADYVNKIEEMLNDKKIYERIKNDPTSQIKTEINKR